jgi:hypothetical protein
VAGMKIFARSSFRHYSTRSRMKKWATLRLSARCFGGTRDGI